MKGIDIRAGISDKEILALFKIVKFLVKAVKRRRRKKRLGKRG